MKKVIIAATLAVTAPFLLAGGGGSGGNECPTNSNSGGAGCKVDREIIQGSEVFIPRFDAGDRLYIMAEEGTWPEICYRQYASPRGLDSIGEIVCEYIEGVGLGESPVWAMDNLQESAVSVQGSGLLAVEIEYQCQQ